MPVAIWFDSVFWPLYPRKVAKTAARKSLLRIFKGLNPEAEDQLGDAIMDGLESYIRREWRNREPELIPHAATWLNQHRWEDDRA